MIFARPFRKALALFVVALLLFYQGAMAAQVCESISLPDSAPAGASPCHEHDASGSGQQNAPGTIPSAPCHYAQVASDSWQPNVPSVVELPPLPAPAVVLVSASQLPRQAVAFSPPCESPPLTVLHCRFLN
jgi:hypothetical protein